MDLIKEYDSNSENLSSEEDPSLPLVKLAPKVDTSQLELKEAADYRNVSKNFNIPNFL